VFNSLSIEVGLRRGPTGPTCIGESHCTRYKLLYSLHFKLFYLKIRLYKIGYLMDYLLYQINIIRVAVKYYLTNRPTYCSQSAEKLDWINY
jgi:hypothetical protein